MKTAILGGGITGVTLADRLTAKNIDWTLFEAGPKLGGLCGSETHDGFVGDISGGHIIFSKSKEVMNYLLEALGPNGAHQSKRNTFIYYRGKYVQYPFENGLYDLPKEDNYECLAGYVDAHMKRKLGAPEPENFKDWSLWRFGKGICEKFMFPYNEKIWKVDLSELSTRWVRGRVPDAPVEDVLRASVGIKTEGYVHQSIFYYPMTGGFEQMVLAIGNRLDQKRLRIGSPVKSLVRSNGKYLVNGEAFDRVISTIPLKELVKVLDGVPADVTAAFGRLAHTSIASLLVAVDHPARYDHSWIYFPHPENGPFNRVTHLSNYSPNNAPPGKSSLMCEITYHDKMDVGPEFQRQCVKNLADCGLIDASKVLWTRVWTNKYAYILYRHDLEENLDVVKGWLKKQGIDILGRFGNYDYYNSDQCVKAAMEFAAGY